MTSRPVRPAHRLAPGVLVLLGLLAWANSLGTPFVFDDAVSVVDNPSIRHLWPPWAAMWAPAGKIMAGRLLPNLTLALNHAVGGLDPHGYHLVNLALHVAAGLALFGIVRRTLPHAGLPEDLDGLAPALAWVVAAVWLVHPLQTDAVTYVTQRTEVLMGLCYLLTLYAAVRAWEAPRPWAAASVVACACGMASKEVMVSAPLMVALYDRVFLAPSFAAAWERRRALYAGLAATWAIFVALLVFTPRTDTIGFAGAIGPRDYLATEAGVLVQYLRLALWPSGLSIDHGVWVARTAREVVVPGLIVLALLAGTTWSLTRWRPIGFLGAWFFGILAPTSSVVPIVTEVMAERRMYLPLAAVVALVVVGAAVAAVRILGAQRLRTFRVAGGVLAVAVIAALAVLTVARNRVYASEESVLADAFHKRPDNYRVRSNLADILTREGRLQEAEALLVEAIRLEPRFPNAHYNLGTVFLRQERYADAVTEYERTLALEPSHAQAHVNLGTALFSLGRLDEARRHYAEGIRLDPTSAAARNNLGMLLLNGGRADAAVAELTEAVRLDPETAQYRENLQKAWRAADRAPPP